VIRVFSLLCSFFLSIGAVAEISPVVPKVPDRFEHLDATRVTLGSVKAAIVDARSGAPLYSKNADVQAPVASITKLMTAMVVLDGGQPLNEMLTIQKVERESDNNGYSRMRIGSRLSRGDLLRVMLMASENLAASNLAVHYPGGFKAFVAAMNQKALALGMTRSRFADASGLSVNNLSTAADLVKMVSAANQYELIREFSTTGGFTARFDNPRYTLRYGNTNRLVHRSSWNIGISKTGYLNEAGRCLVMTTTVEGREVIMVLLDSFGKLTPIGDAGRIKRWLTTGASGTVAGAALNYERTKSASYR
jgi:D-alanyl-D-alanine endopeptidase (penicillin-binding protein 7)